MFARFFFFCIMIWYAIAWRDLISVKYQISNQAYGVLYAINGGALLSDNVRTKMARLQPNFWNFLRSKACFIFERKTSYNFQGENQKVQNISKTIGGAFVRICPLPTLYAL